MGNNPYLNMFNFFLVAPKSLWQLSIENLHVLCFVLKTAVGLSLIFINCFYQNC